MRRVLVVGVCLLGLVACSTTDPSTDATGSSAAPAAPDGTASGDRSSSPSSQTSDGDGGWAAFADVIPASATGPGHELALFDTSAVLDLGVTPPAVDDADFAWFLQDVSVAVGSAVPTATAWDGLGCAGGCDPDTHGPDFADAMGYQPLGFDRVAVVGAPPGTLMILQGGIDPDAVAAAFEDEPTYTVAPDGDAIRVDSDCPPMQVRCVEPSIRDNLGRGLHLYADGTWTAISLDPADIEAFVAAVTDGSGALAPDAPEIEVLGWADELDLLAGAGWAPAADATCGSTELPDATAALTGITGDPVSGDAAVVERVRLAATGDDVPSLDEDPALGCLGEPIETIGPIEATVTDGVVTLTAPITETYEPFWLDAPTVTRGAAWAALHARRDLPWGTPAS